ncbi:hypothetical protein F383_09567 [Gossypium arboreum]|uniref:Uncharacterized protein n=1 Tax=Gossypium arboreum TaxID=29729 RepID=A0A0B0NCR1_GOSAR|nr:hypothetical protein F383_09567 [Gossypium arboreum]
MASGADKGRI